VRPRRAPGYWTTRTRSQPDAGGFCARRGLGNQVGRDRPLIITAQGLLPYFERDQVLDLFADWARRLPGVWLLFDAVTPQGPLEER
jgi:O-methyltransferase involved in polyketide biosynthesis